MDTSNSKYKGHFKFEMYRSSYKQKIKGHFKIEFLRSIQRLIYNRKVKGMSESDFEGTLKIDI